MIQTNFKAVSTGFPSGIFTYIKTGNALRGGCIGQCGRVLSACAISGRLNPWEPVHWKYLFSTLRGKSMTRLLCTCAVLSLVASAAPAALPAQTLTFAAPKTINVTLPDSAGIFHT